MIKLSKYFVGIKPKDKAQTIICADALEETEEDLFLLLIPESVVEDLKKGDIGEWE